jgi:amino acid transporter
VNGALIQIVMASRVLYGLSSRGQLPALFSKINNRTRTPLFATALVTTLVFFFAISGSLLSLVQLTSLIMLTIFSLINLALWRIKRTDLAPEGKITFPLWVPIIGFFISSTFVLLEMYRSISNAI